MNLANILGTLGVSGILLAYFLSLSGRLPQDSYAYLWLNATGAALACASSVLLGSIPFTVLEATWTLVSLIALLRKARAKPRA
ncbi:MAG: hypothetical protein D6722_12535 [Bacteroidetes bacterium]|nr:MAG: hypothetical protein D6722_12535 [Bacteroidota bacterium]